MPDVAAVPPSAAGILADLEAEQDRLEAILGTLDQAAWTSPSAAPGWSVADVVLHLAISEELVAGTLAAADATMQLERAGSTLDEVMDSMVAAQRADPPEVFDRWRTARRSALEALARADPDRPVAWAAAPLRPATLATTRLAEHWAHGLDVTGPLGIAFPDTDRLRHVAWLAHRTLPYAFALAQKPSADVRCVLTGPGGDVWVFGAEQAASVVQGPAGDFCRVAAQRLLPQRSSLTVSGPHGAEALAVARTYAA